LGVGSYGHVGYLEYVGHDSGGNYVIVSNDNAPVGTHPGYTNVMTIYAPTTTHPSPDYSIGTIATSVPCAPVDP
jgi:hypothetical protein